MKLQNKVFGTIFGVIASSLVFIAVPVTANAGECSAEDPCHTYAMVNDSGLVTNIIVCQPSVCGSGTFAGSRVVLQVAANSETHKNQGGYYNPEGSGREVTESNGTFTMHQNNPVVNKDVETLENNVTVSTSVTIANGPSKTFTYEDTIGKNQNEVVMKENPLPLATSAEINIESVSTIESVTATVKENIIFKERKTEQEFVYTLNQSGFTLMNSRIARLSRLLGLGGWFA